MNSLLSSVAINRPRRIVIAAACGVVLGSQIASAQIADLTRLSLEDLLNTEVTSVSRKEQTLSRTAAAVHVITQEDIRRSGAANIPTLLRMVPGFAVGQVDASSWAVTSRGFNGVYVNKLLVLVDGRSVYSLMFGGVEWDMQTLPLGDIERIEVVRGPGGSLWGANAVNGVINIITKSADATQGGLTSIGTGSEQPVFGDARYGGAIGDRAHYRLFGKFTRRESGRTLESIDNPDGASVRLGGARIDWRGEIDTMSFHGSVQDGFGRHVERQTSLDAPGGTAWASQTDNFTEGNVAFTWTRSSSSRSENGVQASYQRYVREEQLDGIERWQIMDVDARRRQAIGQRHEIVAGVGYRFAASENVNLWDLTFLPPRETTHTVTGFIQDEIAIAESLRVTPGSKFERNSYTGFEMQPSIRLTWTPSPSHAIWGAVSRGVRTPSKLDRGMRAPVAVAAGPLPVVTMFEGNPAYATEQVGTVEAGYRVQVGRVSLDVTGFRNRYDDLRAIEAGAVTLDAFDGRPFLKVPLRFTNGTRATAYGAELMVGWQPARWWKVDGWYAWLDVQSVRQSDQAPTPADGPVPPHQAHVRAYFDLPRNVEASALVFGGAASTPAIGAYTRLDLRLAWRAFPGITVALTGHNLFHNDRIEFVDVTGVRSRPVRTSAAAELTWTF